MPDYVVHHPRRQAYTLTEDCCLLGCRTRLHGATTQKTAIFIHTAVRTSNPTYIDWVSWNSVWTSGYCRP
jgi:hypothetical protein